MAVITCDALVIGVGGVGSAALLHLADAGLHPIGVDTHIPPHQFGSSHGQTRAIRQAYFEHPDYVPLLRRAYVLWDELEQRTNATLFHRVGLLEAGPADGIVVPGVLRSAEQHQLPVQRWTVDEARRHIPSIRLDDTFEVVFEENAGFLLVEQCVEMHCQQAKLAGAEIHQANVRECRITDAGVEVQTDRQSYQAPCAIITAGAWARSILENFHLELPVHVVRKHLHWHPTTDSRYQWNASPTFPVFFIEEHGDETGMKRFFYGFPQLDPRGVKVAEHSDATSVDNPSTDPRTVEPEDQRRVADFVARRLENVETRAVDHSVCFYTMSPDDHFIVDVATRPHGATPRVAFAAGLSGHGFKFTTVLGEILAQVVLEQPPSCDTHFLRLGRFANQ